MKPESAAAFIRRELEHASATQLRTLGTARRRRPSSTVPAFPEATRKRLKHAVVAAGYDAMGVEQDRILRNVWSGITRAPVPRTKGFRAQYALVSRDGLSPAVLQAADLEAQGVFWSLLADPASLMVADRETMLRSWNKAGLRLPS